MFFRTMMICIALCAGSVAAAAEPRAPTGKWNVDFGDSHCIAVRDYGTPENPLRLVLKAPPVGDVMQVAVLRKDRTFHPQQVNSLVTVGSGRAVRTDLLMHTPKGAEERIYLLNMPPSDFAPMRQAKTFSIRSKGLDESFALSGMEPLMKVVDRCVEGLRALYNIDATGSRFSSRAHTNIASLFSDGDYPAVALSKDQSGTVRYPC